MKRTYSAAPTTTALLLLLVAFCIFAAFAVPMNADDTKPPATPAGANLAPPVVPPIPSDLRARFWRARAEYVAADVAREKAQATVEGAIQAMAAWCPTGPKVIVGEDGEPRCAPKDAAPPAPAPDKK